MKKISAFMMILILVISSVMPVQGAWAFVYDTKCAEYSESPVWYGSGVVGYDNSVTRFFEGVGKAVWQPEITQAGVYKVSVWNVAHSTNKEMLDGEVGHKNGITPFSFRHNGVEPGFVELGEFEFEQGKTGYIQINSTRGSGYTRVNTVKLEMVSGEGNPVEFNPEVPTGDVDYPSYSYREIPKKDVALPEIKKNSTVIYVSPDGNGDGTKDAPLGGLKAAQEKVRMLLKSGVPEGGIGVYLMGGTYSLEDTLRFTHEDSGKEGSPVIWKSYSGQEVIITGGAVIGKENIRHAEMSELEKVRAEARDKIYVADLFGVGIGKVTEMDLKNDPPYVLLIGDKAGKTARWPNVGYGNMGNLADTSSRVDSGPRKKGFTYDITDPTALRWAEAENAWLNGYWLTPYTIDYSQIASIDADRMLMAGKQDNALGAYGNARYYVENLMEELDAEGEWYLDNDTNKLYYIPFEGYENEELSFVYKNNDLIEFDSASHIVLRGVKIRGGGKNGITFDKNSANCLVAGKEIKYVSGVGAFVDGKNNCIRDMDISYTGSQGIYIKGGDEYKVIRGNNVAENNVVHDVGTGGGLKHGVIIEGCGNSVLHNHIYNGLNHGISGNNGLFHTVEYNIVERTSLEMGDTGAIYFHCSAMGYGSKIRYNIVRDSVGILPILGLTGDGAMGIYLDNATSGFEVTHNILINMAEPGLFSNGGRENIFSNNFLVNCDEPIYIAESAGVNAAIGNKNNIIRYPIKEEPLKSLYPRLAEIEKEFDEDNSYALSKYNTVTNNIMYDCGMMNVGSVEKYMGTLENNVILPKPEGMDLDNPFKYDFDEARKHIPSFEDIPLDQIGIYTGGERVNTREINFDNRGEAFYPTYPQNGATDVDPEVTFSWSYPNGGIQDAEIFVADNSEFKNVKVYNRSTQTEHSTTLDYGKTYYWRVKAYPMLGYEARWNEGGVYTFTTMSADDKLAGELALAEHLLEVASNGDYPESAVQEVKNICNDAKAMEDKTQAIKNLQGAINEFKESRKMADEKVVLVFDNYELDTVGQRPLGLFLRSYYPLDGRVQKDPLDDKNKVVRFADEHDQHHYGTRWFLSQDGKVDVATSVLPMQRDGAFSIALLKTGINPVESGTINDSAVKVVFAEDGNIYADRERKILMMPYEEKTWYDVCIKLDINEKAYDVYVDGKRMAENVPMFNQAIKEVNTIVYDTLNGESSTGGLKGTFYFDNTIVQGDRKATGRNPYLMDLSINGEQVWGFDPAKFIYDVDSLDGEITYKASEDARVKITDSEDKKIITVISGNYKEFSIYYLKA